MSEAFEGIPTRPMALGVLGVAPFTIAASSLAAWATLTTPTLFGPEFYVGVVAAGSLVMLTAVCVVVGSFGDFLANSPAWLHALIAVSVAAAAVISFFLPDEFSRYQWSLLTFSPHQVLPFEVTAIFISDALWSCAGFFTCLGRVMASRD